MFAKSGIIVTTAIAGLVAVSPLAYAACNHDKHHSSHKDHGGHHYVQADYHHNNHGGGSNGERSCTQRNAGFSTGSGHGGGLINVSNNTVQVPIQACNNNILSNIALGILSSGQHVSSR